MLNPWKRQLVNVTVCAWLTTNASRLSTLAWKVKPSMFTSPGLVAPPVPTLPSICCKLSLSIATQSGVELVPLIILLLCPSPTSLANVGILSTSLTGYTPAGK